jgi:hypothetical protein
VSEDLTDLRVEGRRAWAALEAVHVVPTFSRETRTALSALGLSSRSCYFAARSAPMGPVPPEVTTAAFYVFAPRLVSRALPDAWAVASPAQVLAAASGAAVATLHRLLDGVAKEDEVAEAARLARTACEGLTVAGRPLFAGWASLPWPQEPLLQLWHAATLLREHRGDGHVAALLHAPLDPVEALLTAGLAGTGLPFSRATRGWTDEEWSAAEARLRERGLLDDDGLTAAGRALRVDVEARTDAAAVEGWRRLGLDGTRRLARLVRPWQQLVLASGELPHSLFER